MYLSTAIGLSATDHPSNYGTNPESMSQEIFISNTPNLLVLGADKRGAEMGEMLGRADPEALNRSCGESMRPPPLPSPPSLQHLCARIVSRISLLNHCLELACVPPLATYGSLSCPA